MRNSHDRIGRRDAFAECGMRNAECVIHTIGSVGATRLRNSEFTRSNPFSETMPRSRRGRGGGRSSGKRKGKTSAVGVRIVDEDIGDIDSVSLDGVAVEDVAMNEAVQEHVSAGTKMSDIHPRLRDVLARAERYIGVEGLVHRLKAQRARVDPSPTYEEGAIGLFLAVLTLHFGEQFPSALPHTMLVRRIVAEATGMHRAAVAQGKSVHALSIASMPPGTAEAWNDRAGKHGLLSQWERVGKRWSDQHMSMVLVVLLNDTCDPCVKLTPVKHACVTVPVECVICMERITGGTGHCRPRKCSNCPYLFCGACWARLGDDCPMCRQPLRVRVAIGDATTAETAATAATAVAQAAAE